MLSSRAPSVCEVKSEWTHCVLRLKMFCFIQIKMRQYRFIVHRLCSVQCAVCISLVGSVKSFKSLLVLKCYVLDVVFAVLDSAVVRSLLVVDDSDVFDGSVVCDADDDDSDASVVDPDFLFFKWVMNAW